MYYFVDPMYYFWTKKRLEFVKHFFFSIYVKLTRNAHLFLTKFEGKKNLAAKEHDGILEIFEIPQLKSTTFVYIYMYMKLVQKHVSACYVSM